MLSAWCSDHSAITFRNKGETFLHWTEKAFVWLRLALPKHIVRTKMRFGREWYWSVDRRLILLRLGSLPTISCNLTLTVVCVPIENVRQREVLVDLHKRSLVELYEKNSHTDVSTTHILIPFSIGPRKPSFDFVWLCQSTSCEQKCASDVNGIGPSIDVWYFCGSDRCRRSLATWLWQLYVFRLKMYGSVKY